MIGLYLHIPFCAKKCPYCDFYSTAWRIPLEEQYLAAVNAEMQKFAQNAIPAPDAKCSADMPDAGGKIAADNAEMQKFAPSCTENPAIVRSGQAGAQAGAGKIAANTLYFGGGTPSLIRPQSIAALIDAAKSHFALSPDAEITLECNPSTVSPDRARQWAQAGVNRVSLGMQSTDSAELQILGRRHNRAAVAEAISCLRDAGITNLSLDIMMAIPHQTLSSLAETVQFAIDQRVQHLSTYLLQIEPGTPFAESKIASACPDEDAAAAMYLQTASQLEAAGYRQYEISNFALPGFESRHNNKYWNCEEYLGFGPSAHSYWQGERFCYPADLQSFLQHPTRSDSTPGGDAAEYAMLRLRLMDGLYFADFARRGGDPDLLRRRLAKYRDTDLVTIESERFFLTAKGCLVSNAIICDLLFES